MATSTRSFVLRVSVSLLAIGCGNTGQSAATPDAEVTDISAITDASDVTADTGSSLATFCAGAAAKAQRGDTLLSPATVSSSELVLNCCMGVVLRFHVPDAFGGRLDVLIRGMGGNPPKGDLDLANPPEGLEVTLAQDATSVTASLSGTVRLDRPGNYTAPSHASLCAEIHAPGAKLDGVRLYVHDFPVSNWGWKDRLTLRLLADPTMKANAAAKQTLSSLVLATEPIISLTDIGWYSSAKHQLFWDQLATTAALRNKVGVVGTQGVPFVVEADGRRVYLGTFFSLVSSESFPGPTVLMENLTDAGLTIDPAYPAQPPGTDLRADPRILKVLTEAGKLVH